MLPSLLQPQQYNLDSNAFPSLAESAIFVIGFRNCNRKSPLVGGFCKCRLVTQFYLLHTNNMIHSRIRRNFLDSRCTQATFRVLESNVCASYFMHGFRQFLKHIPHFVEQKLACCGFHDSEAHICCRVCFSHNSTIWIRSVNNFK